MYANAMKTYAAEMAKINMTEMQALADASNQTLAEVLNAGAAPAQCEGGAEPTQQELDVVARDAFPRDGTPSFNLAMNLVGVFSAVGTILANQIIPRLSNKYGRTPFMAANLGFGALVYVAMFFVATSLKSYWGYCVMMLLQGFFAGTMTLATTYFTDIYEKDEDRNKWSGAMMGVFMLLGAGGVLLAEPFKGVGLFHACWLGVACEVVGLAIIVYAVPESHMPVGEAKLLSGLKKKNDAPTPDANADASAKTSGPPNASADKEPQKETRDAATLKRDLFRLKWVMAGSVVDSIGSTGFSYAMGTLMVIRFPCTANIYTSIMAAVIGVYIVGMMLGMPIMQAFGFGASTVVGNVAAVVFQIILGVTMEESAFLAFLFVGWSLSLQSALTTNPMIMKFAPQDELGTWLGINASIENATSQFGTFIFAAVYEAFVAIDKANAEDMGLTYEEYVGKGLQEAGRNIMITCAAISAVSTVMAIPTAIWFPPKKKATVAPSEMRMEDYKIPEDGAVSNIPAAVIDKINEKRLADGLAPLTLRFGSYAADVFYGLPKLQVQGHADIVHAIKDMKKFTKDMKTKPEETTKMINDFAEYTKAWYTRPDEDKQKERMDLANWFCDYLEDAGYNYTGAPAFWKSVFMNAFPPIGRFEEAPAGKERNDAVMANIHRWESFAHMHLKMEKTGDHNVSSVFSTRASTGVTAKPGSLF